MQSTVAKIHINMSAPQFLVVQRIVLDTSCHSVLLQLLDVRYAHHTGQIRVLAHIFKITPTQLCPLDIDTRRKNNILASATRLSSKNLTAFFCPLRVPGSCYCTVRRKIGHSIITVIYILPVIIDKFLTHSHRTVRHVKLRYSKARHTRRPEQTCAMYHSNLLIQGHLIYK